MSVEEERNIAWFIYGIQGAAMSRMVQDLPCSIATGVMQNLLGYAYGTVSVVFELEQRIARLEAVCPVPEDD